MSRFIHLCITIFCLYFLLRYYHNNQQSLVCDKQELTVGITVSPLHSSSSPPMEQYFANYCAGEQKIKCVQPFYGYKQEYRTANKYRLLGCAIEKNFSTMLTAIICYLNNENTFVSSGKTILSELFHRRFCGSINEFESLTAIEKKFSLSSWEGWQLIAVIRDPIDRFVSGFVNKCLREKTWRKYPDRCNRCKSNLTCFVERQYNRMMRRARGEQQVANFDDNHFIPQNWRCGFYSNFHNYSILHYDSHQPTTFLENLLRVFQKNNVSQSSLEYIKNATLSGRTNHSTIKLLERNETEAIIRADSHLMDLLIKMYYYDFVLFGFPLPVIPNSKQTSQ